MNRDARTRLRLPLVLALATVLVGSVFAGGAVAGGNFTIQMERDGRNLFFEPKTTTLNPTDNIILENTTNPDAVGPHTFSLVEKRVRPKGKQEKQNCFKPGRHICRRIVKWHGGQQVPINPVDVGLPGWDTMGDKDETGDSWFTQTKNETFTQTVSADAGSTLYFMCAIHPGMQGKVVVNEL